MELEQLLRNSFLSLASRLCNIWEDGIIPVLNETVPQRETALRTALVVPVSATRWGTLPV